MSQINDSKNIDLFNSYDSTDLVELANSDDLTNLKSSNKNTKNSKTYKEMFIASKLYFKYLSVVKSKINNLNVETDILHQTIFMNDYETSSSLITEINKEWFWITNNDIFKIYKTNNCTNMEQHKKRFIENFTILESICNNYGFDKWAENKIKSQVNS